MQEQNINFFSTSKSKFYECASVKIKIKRKRKEKKIGDIDFLISVYILEVFLMLSTTFLEKILLGLESCLINACVKKSRFI